MPTKRDPGKVFGPREVTIRVDDIDYEFLSAVANQLGVSFTSFLRAAAAQASLRYMRGVCDPIRPIPPRNRHQIAIARKSEFREKYIDVVPASPKEGRIVDYLFSQLPLIEPIPTRRSRYDSRPA